MISDIIRVVKERGKITPNGVVLKTNENATAVFLTEQGFDIELIPTSRPCFLIGKFSIKKPPIVKFMYKSVNFESSTYLAN